MNGIKVYDKVTQMTCIATVDCIQRVLLDDGVYVKLDLRATLYGWLLYSKFS